jgi:hypothetical protein
MRFVYPSFSMASRAFRQRPPRKVRESTQPPREMKARAFDAIAFVISAHLSRPANWYVLLVQKPESSPPNSPEKSRARLIPDELVLLAERMVASTDPQEIERLKKEMAAFTATPSMPGIRRSNYLDQRGSANRTHDAPDGATRRRRSYR